MAVLVPSKPVFPCIERLLWRTQFLRGGDGSEQRIGFRRVPRQVLEYTYPFETDARNAAWDALLHYHAKRPWYVPLWGEQVRHAATLAAGATTISIATANTSWRTSGYGNYALIWQSPDAYEIVTVSGKTASTLTVSAIGATYAGGCWIVPCRTGYLLGSARRRRWQTGVSLVTCIFECWDNGIAEAYSAATEYDNMPVITTAAYAPQGVYELSTDPDAAEIDSDTGRRRLDPDTDFNIDVQSHQIVNTTRAACWTTRQWLHWANGPQKSFLVPTYRDDITLAAPCLSTATTIDVVNRGYSDYYGDNWMRDYIAFRPVGADIICRRIEGMAELSATQERLTLNAAPGAGFGAGANLCWVDCCRLAYDAVTIEWIQPCSAADRHNGRAIQRLDLALRRVPAVRTVFGGGVFGMGVLPA